MASTFNLVMSPSTDCRTTRYPDLSMEIDVDNLPMQANEVIEQFVHQLRKLGAPEHAVRIDVTAALRDVLRSGPRAELEER
jgi:hypothetical protein